jgi:PAS domain S-box-containing protein
VSGREHTKKSTAVYRFLLRRFGVGRILKLRLILGLLMLGSLAFVGYNLYSLTRNFHQTGSLAALWRLEWQSGASVTAMLRGGVFQLFVLILGWSMFFRLRVRELGHLRLRRSEHKYRSIINHAGEAIFLLDDKGRVIEWNKKAERLFGVYRRHALGVNICKLDTGLDLPVLKIFADVERAQRSFTYEAQVEKKSGEPPTQLSLTFSCINAGSGPMADKTNSFAVIARDITSEKQLESRMSETEKLAGIGQLAAGIAHQLNTPLGAILLSAQMLEETVQNEDDSEDIRRIIRQTEQCRGIIKGLLNFARPTGSERGRIDLTEVIDSTVFLMEKKLKVASVALHIAVETEPWVFGNRNELEQVFFNLLANALDALDAVGNGGQVNVVLSDGGAGELKVVFADNGEGIPEAARGRIFLPFFTTKDYGKGTGLGLSIVARIVHEHGGRIELASASGRGTTFTLWFPRARDSHQDQGVGHLALIDDEIADEETDGHAVGGGGQSPVG